MSPLAYDIDRAIQSLRDRLASIDEEIAALCVDIPGDAGVIPWPREIADQLDALHDERDHAEEQLTLLLTLKPQVA